MTKQDVLLATLQELEQNRESFDRELERTIAALEVRKARIERRIFRLEGRLKEQGGKKDA
jgi:hypothetical protein